MKKKILCVGMMVCDTLLSTVPSNILELDSVSIQRPVISCGGDALNVAMGLAKLDSSVSIVGRIADDSNGKFILEECSKYGVDTSGVVYDDLCATASSFALIDINGERHFLSEKSIFARLIGKDIPQQFIENADYIYFGSAMAMSSMNGGGIYELFSSAHDAGKITIMDASINLDEEQQWLTYLTPAFSETDIFFPSMDEAVKITGKQEPSEIADCFIQFKMKMFGIKLGARGCYMTDFKNEYYIDCPKNSKVVDTTGAGDSFMAGLICAMANGWESLKAVEFAVSIATQNVGAMGGTSGIPNFEEALNFYQSWKK